MFDNLIDRAFYAPGYSDKQIALPKKQGMGGRNMALSKQTVDLSEAEQRYHCLLQVTIEPVIVHSGGRIVLVNDAAAKLLGATNADQLIGRAFQEFMQAEGVEESIGPSVTCRSGSYPDERTIIRLNQSRCRAMVIATPCRYQDQAAMQLVVRDARDCQQGELPEPIQSGLTTELPNRSQFCDRLKGAIARANRNQQRVGVLLLGMDHFKLVNTTLGHRAGDLVLNRVAERLAQCVRLVDTAARVGGDEFSLVLEGITDRQQAATVAQRTLKLLSQPMQIGDQEVQLSASIGIAVHPLDTDDPDTLLQKADAAMYYAKENARGSYQFYSPDVDAQPSDHQLRRADIKARFERLTAREREVLELVVAGKTNKMIANLLGASSRTIENHRAKIMEKMQAGSLPQLVQMVFDLRAR